MPTASLEARGGIKRHLGNQLGLDVDSAHAFYKFPKLMSSHTAKYL